jgi:hypothetical protein
VRVAFYQGILPLLGPVASGFGTSAETLLFCTLDELANGKVLVRVAKRRRDAYLGDIGYRHHHGMRVDRLADLVGSQ